LFRKRFLADCLKEERDGRLQRKNEAVSQDMGYRGRPRWSYEMVTFMQRTHRRLVLIVF
jgi:hypothetical protein